jgi:glycosyltransferase involved in cell wall biosynthesis
MRADLVITGGYMVKMIYNNIFNLSPKLIKVCEHPEPKYFNAIENNLVFDELNIGIIGAISMSKGSYMIQEMSNHFKKLNIQCRIYHFGSGYNLNHKRMNNIINMGKYYSEKDLYDKLIKNNIYLLWFPAYRHESFCYTLTLAMQTCLPILAYDCGTFRERLTKYKYPYMIHTCEYKLELLYDDIILFWNNLRDNKHENAIIESIRYDNIEYNKIYEIK